MSKSALQRAAAQIRTWRENPAAFAFQELKFEPDVWQKEFFDSLPSQDKKQLAIKSCTGPGKSAVLAVANLWFIATHGGTEGNHPKAAIVSINEANLKSNIWAELSKWQSRSQYLQDAFTWSASRFSSKEFPATWWIEARSWQKKADLDAQGRTLSGLHAPFVMATLDECGDIPVPILRSAQQIFSSEHKWAKILAGGNPTSLDGVLYQLCVTEADRTYSINISADPDDPKRAKRTDLENAKMQIGLYGRTNPWVMATILGEFPPSSISALLGIEEVETAMGRHYLGDAYDWAQKRLGVDCARFGDDRTTLCPRQGVAWFKAVEMRGVRTNIIAARIINATHKWAPLNPQEVLIMIDQTGGWGQGTVDQLLVAGYSPIDLVYSTPASNPKYFNIRSQMWFEMADHVRRSAAIPPSLLSLKKELTAPTYSLREGKIIIEPKELIKKRLGFSPDLGDGYAQTYALPDMPAGMASILGRTSHAKSDWDPYEEREEPRHDPYVSPEI